MQNIFCWLTFINLKNLLDSYISNYAAYKNMEQAVKSEEQWVVSLLLQM